MTKGVIDMSYREKLSLRMTPKEVLEVLGNPDHMTKDDIFIKWEWLSVSDEDSEFSVSICFVDGVVSSIKMTGTNLNMSTKFIHEPK